MAGPPTPQSADSPKSVDSPSETLDAGQSDSDGVQKAIATTKKLLKTGMKCETKDFYPTERGEWTEKYPRYIKGAVENDQTAQFAVLRRNMKSSDTRKKLSLHSIVVQSPLIKRVLGTVFDGYEGVTTGLDRLEFQKPFEPFVHRWERLREARDIETDAETRKHIELLWKTLETELKMTLETRDDLVAHGVMTYDLLWTMFEPGTLVFIQKEESERIMRTQGYNYDPDGFSLSSQFVEWTGKKFGMESEIWPIPQYQGTKKITELSVFPMAHHPDTIGLQKRCIARGRIWEAHCRYSFKSYEGVGISVQGLRHNVNSRVIIDTAAFNSFNPNYNVYANDLKKDESYPAPPEDSPSHECGSLTSYHLLLATDMLRGYSLKDKTWLKLHLTGIKEISWNDKAFSSLILPSDTKELVLAFAQSQIKQSQTFDDVIEGKGKGIIMLLSGPPGVGKTLTAEAVAETMRVPLYMMSAGDLGTRPSGVEQALKDILSMTTKWKAVLLLDEADVFLEARSAHDLERNKLVSIFLRTLEYFEGFLFLTSNRVDNIDGAFESRIHLSLQYDSLSLESRRQVWVKFLEGISRGNGFTEEQIDALAQIELNGRQIKNILKTAQLLATSKDAPLSFEHVHIVTKLRAANACIPLRNF